MFACDFWPLNSVVCVPSPPWGVLSIVLDEFYGWRATWRIGLLTWRVSKRGVRTTRLVCSSLNDARAEEHMPAVCLGISIGGRGAIPFSSIRMVSIWANVNRRKGIVNYAPSSRINKWIEHDGKQRASHAGWSEFLIYSKVFNFTGFIRDWKFLKCGHK